MVSVSTFSLARRAGRPLEKLVLSADKGGHKTSDQAVGSSLGHPADRNQHGATFLRTAHGKNCPRSRFPHQNVGCLGKQTVQVDKRGKPLSTVKQLHLAP